METCKSPKTMSYNDLIKSFQQVENTSHPLKQQRTRGCPLQIKKPATRQNKQNISKPHTQSLLQKVHHQQSNWLQQQTVLQQQQSKERQQQLNYNKFITTITGTMMQITRVCPPDLLMIKLTYLQFLQTLQEMAFIKKTYEPSQNDLVSQLWNQLCSYGQTVGIFILIVAGILNMRSPQNQMAKYHYLWNKYADLRYTRLQQLGKIKYINDSEQQFPFSPKLCQKSRDLIANRSKSKDRQQKYMAEKTFCQMQESIESNAQTSQLKQLFNSKAGNRRSEILYKMAKEKSQQKRRDKRSCQVQYEKSITQLTFHPKIYTKQMEKSIKTTIHGEQDSINRMIRGRVEKEVRRIIQEKGLPYNQKMVQRMKNERYNQLIKARIINLCKKKPDQQRGHQCSRHISLSPDGNQDQIVKKQSISSHPLVLSIEVQEGRCQKLVIHEGECYKQVAARFIAQLKLEPDLYSKLVAGVQHALKFQLAQIDQDSFESSCESP